MSGQIKDFRVTGGRLQAKGLHSKLEPAVYAAVKAEYWLRMLKDKMIPKKWFKPTRNGTKISFIYPQTQEEFDAAMEHLKEFIVGANEQFGLGMELGPAKEETA